MCQILQNLFSLIIVILITLCAYIIGYFFIKKVVLREIINISFENGVALLVGYGAIGYAMLILAYFGPISKVEGALFVAVIIILGRQYLKKLLKEIKYIISDIMKWEKFDKLLLSAIVFCFLFYLSSAMVPPYRTDSLAYHLPEIVGITNGGMNYYNKTFAGYGAFYGNLPILMEILYTLPNTLSGFISVHLIHYGIMLAGLCAIYGFIKNKFNQRKALFVILALFSFYDLFVNATNAYIDAAMTAFEICGFLLLLSWLMQKKLDKLLILSGILYGLALGTKYNALYGILIAGIILSTNLIFSKISFKKICNKIIYFGLPILLVGGYWYIKNWVTLGNPIYPFYFGHIGYSEADYAETIIAIKSFTTERTIINFVLFPLTFFFRSYYLILFFAIILWPVIFLYKKISSKIILLNISVYILIYIFIWFFLATHQYKFFYVPAILLLILLGLQIDEILNKTVAMIGKKALLIVCVVIFCFISFKIVTAKNNYFIKVKKADLCYNFAFCNTVEFYDLKKLGSIFRVSDYINTNYTDTVFSDVWSTARLFLSNGNKFLPPGEYITNQSNISSSTFLAYLRKKNISNAILDSIEKQSELSEQQKSAYLFSNNVNVEYRQKAKLVEKVIKEIGKEVYNQYGVSIYQFNL
jgi:4-amino-4-deoxy-L-arabinose transferase-like glycosyltransferase